MLVLDVLDLWHFYTHTHTKLFAKNARCNVNLGKIGYIGYKTHYQYFMMYKIGYKSSTIATIRPKIHTP